MTLADLHDLLDRCGGDAAAWPPGARAGAERLLAAFPEARAALAAQREVDGWFAATGDPAAAPDFAGRAVQARQLPPTSRPGLARWGAGAAVAAAALLAVGLGAATGAAHVTAEEPAQALAQALAGPGEGVDAG